MSFECLSVQRDVFSDPIEKMIWFPSLALRRDVIYLYTFPKY